MYFNETNCRTIVFVLFCGLFGLFLLGFFFVFCFCFLVWLGGFLRVAKMRHEKNMTLFLYLLKSFCAIKKSLITKNTEYISYVGISRRLGDRKKTHQKLDCRGNNRLYGNRVCIEWTYCTLNMFLFVRFTYVSMIGTERRTG